MPPVRTGGIFFRLGVWLNTVLHLDFETKSRINLKLRGQDVYARDESTDILCMAYALGPAVVPAVWYPGQPFPAVVWNHVVMGLPVAAHNAAFEIAIWNYVLRRHWSEGRLNIQ